MLTLIKLGGSLITNKEVEYSFRADVAERIAQEIAAVLEIDNNLPLVIGHGSGSFGHVAAKQYGTIDGVRSREQWWGFAEVATVAAELNGHVTTTLRTAGVPIWRVQPSASAMSRDGVLTHLDLNPIHRAVENGVVPLLYGDVSLDEVRGGTIISTETIFTYLVQNLPVKRVFLMGEVAGVYDADKNIIPEITPVSYKTIKDYLGGSHGTDVTGGMLTKVGDMVALVEQFPDLKVYIIDGTQPDILHQCLLNEGRVGTLIHNGR
jgi:isopentenyl phosphate kinase